jgi:glutathionylspermidine synthase
MRVKGNTEEFIEIEELEASAGSIFKEPDIEHFQILWKMFNIEMNAVDNFQISMIQNMLKRYLILCTRVYKEQHLF